MSKKVVICGVDTSRLPQLSAKERQKMLDMVQDGDGKARSTFIVANFRLVLSVVQRYVSKTNNLDDLFQVGCVGLVKAVDNFDTSVGVKFSTYAVPMIVGEIRRFLRDSNSLKISRSIRDTAFQTLLAREILETHYDREVSLEEVSKAIDLPLSRIVYCLDAINEPISLNEPIYADDSDCILFMDQLADKNSHDDGWVENLSLSQAIAKLSAREQDILRMRYYEGKTQMEISDEIGISQAQVSRLEKNAVATLRLNM